VNTFHGETSMSDDGEHIFFSTPDALVPEDVNGEASCDPVTAGAGGGITSPIKSCEDIYEWHDGTVSLVSGGVQNKPAVLVGGSHSGRDVFFLTTQQLVGWDGDDSTDLYDARVGGGFPEPPPQPPICEGESCRGQGSVPIPVPGAGTGVFEGPGNQAKSLNKKPCRKGKVRRKGKCVKKKKRHKKRHAKRAHHRTANQNRRVAR
jgi:hypothetical protein